jgi:hypothetical protein
MTANTAASRVMALIIVERPPVIDYRGLTVMPGSAENVSNVTKDPRP